MGERAVYCRDCGAHLLFVALVSGRKIAVDRAPDDGRGNVCARRDGSKWTGYVSSQERPARSDNGWRTFMPHAATCASRPRATPTPPPPSLF